MRLFIAVELPAPVRDNLAAAQDALRAVAVNVRWVRPEAIHLTLAFLGEVLAARLQDLVAALAGLRDATPGPIALEARGLGTYPSRGQPRVIWAGLAGDLGALERLREAVAQAVRGAGFALDDRPWRPHLTLGRVQGGGLGTARTAITRDARTSYGAFEVRAVHLMESELLPGGARYTSRHALRLVAAGELP